jgi:hypothetical protein
MQIIAGKTDVSISIYARALSGAALTGKVAADFALSYRRAGANVALSLSDLASIDAAHTDGGIYEVGNGEYRLDLPDAAVATGANQVSVTGTVDGGVLLGYPIQLDADRTPGGTYAQTITVTAGGVAVQGATVQILDAADDSVVDLATTDATGVAVVRCNALSVKFVATKAGYTSYTSAATSVTGAAARSATLTRITITASAPDYTTLYGTVYDHDNAVAASALVNLQIVELPAGDTGHILCDDVRVGTSDGSGYVEWTNCVQGATYVIYRGSGAKKYVVVGTAATQEVTSCMGPA